MADMLHTNFSSNSSIFSLFSTLTLSPHSNFSFVRFAPLRRRFSHSSVVTKLCSDSSQFEIISRIELSDGSVSFKFGDASEISRNLDDVNGGIEVELERESDEGLEGNAVNDGESDSESAEAENFDRNSVELKEIGEQNADDVVDLQSDSQFSGNSVEDEQNCGLISVAGVENLSDFDAGKYENQGGNGVVTMCDSSVGVVIGKNKELSEAYKKSDDDEVENGGDEPSNVGGTSLDVEVSGVVETLENEVVKNEVVSLEDESVKDGTVTGDIVEGDIVSLEEGETVKGGIVEDQIVKDDIVEDEIVKAGIVEDKESLEEDENLKGGIVKNEIVEDANDENKVVSSMGETLKGDIVKDGFVEDEIEEGKVVSLVEETIKGDIVRDEIVEDEIEVIKVLSKTLKDNIVKDKIVEDEIEVIKVLSKTLKDNIVKDKIVEDEIGEGKAVSLVEETVKDDIVKDETVEDDVEEDKVVSSMEETVEGDIVKEKIVEDEIEEDKVLSLVHETLKGNTVKDKIVENEIGEGKVDSLVEEAVKGDIFFETVKGDIVKDKIAEDEIEENKVVSLVDETMKGDIEDEVVSLVDETVNGEDEIVEGEIEEDKVVSLVDETVKGDIVKDDMVKDDIVKDESEEEEEVALENEITKSDIVKNEIVEDEIVEDEIVKKAIVKDEIAEDTSASLEDETEKVCVFTVNHPIPMDEDDDSVELMSKKLEAEPILNEETSSDLQDNVGLGSFLGSNKVHDAIINTVTQSGDDITDSLVAAGPITSEIASPEIDLDSLNKAEPSSPAFSISSAVASLEHFPEALTGGKDAHFVLKNWFGVADSVGQWSLGGVDMGLYAHEFMQNCEKLLKSTSARLTNVKQLLQQSAAITQSTGAARVLIAHLDKEVLHVANIGDSGFVIIRNGTVVQKSSPMIHEFSFPYAIGLGDDSVEDAEEYHINLEDGDVIVTATDGLFDNLYDKEIASMVSKVLEAGMSLQDLAELLATTAAEVGRSKSARSPFADAAKAAGHPGYCGGKLDHVTVIVSLVHFFFKIVRSTDLKSH
ncbi:probable protein phosphatase 2C 62 isoform X2 [Chenopodium quinoa]|uniref:probable protein phosphatase 2C 62 isoform X2 n=1 Tax=Chenopodium quinoa TaxID=63459 RepID=UPI000B770352|nr:probable protein phosphatase 2C 62 isoform X2 [Chenopodium quinoa]